MAKKRSNTKTTERKVNITPERVFIYALGVGAVGGAIYFAREYYLSLKAQRDQSGDTSTTSTSSNTKSVFNIFSSSANDSFPLKKGSRGARVRQLQQALVSILGASVFQQFSPIDGIFGTGTQNALRQAGYGTTVDEALFNQIVNNQPTIVFNPQDLAQKLYNSANAKDSNGVMSILRQIQDTTQYSAVNQSYKSIGFISKTIVTHLLDQAFVNDSLTKERIKAEFIRMGLKLDASSGRWSLSGFAGFKDIITITDTYVIDRNKNRIPVRRNTILGDEQQVSNGMTMFKAIDNSMALVPSDHVKYV
ncbi:MAG: peptidoglycan-binding domain-containing protein [Cytophagales bacterium]